MAAVKSQSVKLADQSERKADNPLATGDQSAVQLEAITEYVNHAAPVHRRSAANKAINRALRSIDGSVVGSR
jgi:hypothetical protein